MTDDSEFVCECGAEGCTETIRLPLGEYEAVRREARYLVAPRHSLPGMVVVVGARYVVVEGTPADSPR